MDHFWPQFFGRWYIGVFLIVWGASLFFRARSLNDIRDGFCNDPSDELEAVLERRQRLEARPLSVWYVTGAVSIASGVATFIFPAFNGGLAYALTCVAFVIGLVGGYLRMQNSSPRRAAALVPRRFDSVVPWPWYPVTALAALAPLTFIDVVSLRAAAVLVTVSAFTIAALAIRASSMPALLTGESIDVEIQVDGTLREKRVNALWSISIGVSYVFIVLAVVSDGATLLQGIAFDYLLVVFVARFGPMVVSSIRGLVRL
jgi:hypothetical protein